MATRTVTVHDRCTTPECGRVLISLAEAERGTCSTCWMRTMPADTKKSLNRLIASAFKTTTEAEKGEVVQDALDKLKRDREAA